MRIYKDSKTGIYHADYHVDGKRVRPSLHTTNKTIALLRAGEKISNKDSAVFPGCPFSNFKEKYLAYMQSRRSAGTLQHIHIALNKLNEFRRVENITDLTPALLMDFQTWEISRRKKTQQNAGINKHVQTLKTMMRQAEKWELISPRRWENVGRLKEPKGRIEFHTPEEIYQILSFCDSDMWRLVVLLGCRAGLRRGEMAALKWPDIDFKNKQIYIAPNKTEKFRYVPISADLLLALQKAPRSSKDNFVIHVGNEENRTSPYYITAAYAKKMKSLGFKCFLHKLRHTFASHLVQQGVDLYRVSKLLGHSSIQMTEIYAHLSPADLHQAISLLPAITK